MSQVKCKFCTEFEETHGHERMGTCLGCAFAEENELEKLADLHEYESQFG